MANYQGKEWSLRLMPQPVHQYASTSADGSAVSGVCHFFCRQNDPEAMLLLEVRPNEDGVNRWHYAAASFTDAGAHVSHNGDEVWDEDPVISAKDYRHYGYSANPGIRLQDAIRDLTRNSE